MNKPNEKRWWRTSEAMLCAEASTVVIAACIMLRDARELVVGVVADTGRWWLWLAIVAWGVVGLLETHTVVTKLKAIAREGDRR